MTSTLPRRRIVVATCDPVTDRMAGPAIRAWHMAEALSAEHEVRLVSIAEVDRPAPLDGAFSVDHVGTEDLVALERWMDVLVFQGGLLRIHPYLAESDKVIVADIYDPFHLENLEQTRGRPEAERHEVIEHLTGVLNDQLRRGDFFLAASPRQRDFWMGSLAALGRVNPSTYEQDPTMSGLVDLVPFGLPASPPVKRRPVLRGVVPGIGPDDVVLLWAGGVYNWFDPLTLVRAVDRLRVDEPTLRLFFLGLQHPNPDIPAMSMATELRTLSDELGLTGVHVFFNEGWVPYDERADYLLEADVGVSTHLDHVETAYSFRTRILDYIWASLPIVTTQGDAFAELVEARSLGATAAAGDVDGLTVALRSLVAGPARRAACRAQVAAVAPDLAWDVALAPLLRFCRAPRRADDLVRACADVAPNATHPATAAAGMPQPGGWRAALRQVRSKLPR